MKKQTTAITLYLMVNNIVNNMTDISNKHTDLCFYRSTTIVFYKTNITT